MSKHDKKRKKKKTKSAEPESLYGIPEEEFPPLANASQLMLLNYMGLIDRGFDWDYPTGRIYYHRAAEILNQQFALADESPEAT